MTDNTTIAQRFDNLAELHRNQAQTYTRLIEPLTTLTTEAAKTTLETDLPIDADTAASRAARNQLLALHYTALATEIRNNPNTPAKELLDPEDIPQL